jgi:Arabinose-binding domain of AraC transcription regulator, N-term
VEAPLLWTRGVAARETLSYLDRRGIDAEPALSGAGISRRQLSQDDIGLSVASQYRFLELAAAEANDQLLGLHAGQDGSPHSRRRWRRDFAIRRQTSAPGAPCEGPRRGLDALRFDPGPGNVSV